MWEAEAEGESEREAGGGVEINENVFIHES